MNATEIPTVKPQPRPQPKAKAKANVRAPGWWSLAESGSAAGVSAKIDASDAPDYWKAAIKSDIEKRCVGGINFVYLDAHFHVEKGNASLHYTLQALKADL